jgi:hypothetical protein
LLDKISFDEFQTYKNNGGKLWIDNRNSPDCSYSRNIECDNSKVKNRLMCETVNEKQNCFNHHIQQQQQNQNLVPSSSLLFATQPNFCFQKLNKMSLNPVKIGQNKFGFPIPRKVLLKPKCAQNIFFNLSLAFPFGTIPIFRPTLELLVHKDNVSCQILNSQDGSTYVTNLIMRIKNNNRLQMNFNRGTILATVVVKNALSDLHPLKVSQIVYDTTDVNKLGVVHIRHE